MIKIECPNLTETVGASNYQIRFYEGDRDPHDEVRAPDGTKQLVLIVDDDPDSALSRSMLVQRAGYDAVTVSGLDAALATPELIKRFGAQPPALILMDYNMPHIDGFTLAKELKKLEIPLNVACITVTSVADFRPTLLARTIVEQLEGIGVPVCGGLEFATNSRNVLRGLLSPALRVQTTQSL